MSTFDDEEEEPKQQSWMDSGEWAAMTMGAFLQLLVDGGTTDVVFVRVTGAGEPNENGEFKMMLDVHVVPNGQVLEHAGAIGCTKFNVQYLVPLLEKGIIK